MSNTHDLPNAHLNAHLDTHSNVHFRTRFAPSPTGFIHLGNIRSALYPWAYARHCGGKFILRIEDTDVERSTPEAVQAILDSMAWLKLNLDEGPFFQTQHMARYREVIEILLQKGLAYRCYMSEEELDALREEQRAHGQKPRYNGYWRPEAGKILPPIPTDRQPVIRFKNPLTGLVSWEDQVKGQITISNEELDDLVIARPDGTPTYNFCVVVDDIDMKITHVIRGDDHVNNTPRQINIFKALEQPIPIYAHLPTVLNEQGEKMSKRNGAMGVMQYKEAGYLPEAMINYLARLGWSHGDDEIFSQEQLIEWFDPQHLGQSPTQHNPEKLLWLNQHYIKTCDKNRLAELTMPFLQRLETDVTHGPSLSDVLELLKDRSPTLVQLAENAQMFFREPQPAPELLQQHVTEAIRPALASLIELFTETLWEAPSIQAAFKTCLAQHTLKMPLLAMPVRLLVVGQLQTPSIDAVLALLNKDTVLQRLATGLR